MIACNDVIVRSNIFSSTVNLMLYGSPIVHDIGHLCKLVSSCCNVLNARCIPNLQFSFTGHSISIHLSLVPVLPCCD